MFYFKLQKHSSKPFLMLNAPLLLLNTKYELLFPVVSSLQEYLNKQGIHLEQAELYAAHR